MTLSQRETGSFYTPEFISEFIVKRASKKHKGRKLQVLEPSAGDGSFIKSLYLNDSMRKRMTRALAIELNSIESKKIKSITQCKTLTVKTIDFLDYQSKEKEEIFDLIIGNPPYVKKNLLSSTQIDRCQKIHSTFPQLSRNSIKNIWSSFLIRSISLLKSEGVLAFVLPAELLQVKFTAEIRKLLVAEFKRIEIFTFNELLFEECKGQDTLILMAERESSDPGLFFHNVVDVTELSRDDFDFVEKDLNDESKWTSHCLTEEEISLINNLKSSLKTIDQYSESKAGIVTGANDFFILNEEKVKEFGLKRHSKYILQKGGFVKSWIEFNDDHYQEIVDSNKPCLLVDLNNKKPETLAKLDDYFIHGISQGINERYKAKIRDFWYQVPNIGEASPALFFKRGYDFPKLVINNAKVLATDSAYLVNPKNDVDIKSLVLSFYNSLTLIFSELNGRFYGGGVLELTPNEFKSLPIPYLKITNKEYLKYSKLFNSGVDFDSVIREMDGFILRKTIPNIKDSEIEMLNIIRKKLLIRRKKL